MITGSQIKQWQAAAASRSSNVTRGNSDGWENVCRVLTKHYHEPDLEAARVLYAAVAAHNLTKQQPVWPMAVAPPGSMKTELIRALDGMENVHSIDAVTSRTFVSGQIRTPERGAGGDDRSSSLLHRIGRSGIILCADFSTVLSTKADDRNVIFADLRRIYDGELRKEFGTSETVETWKGRLTFVAAVTDAIDKQYAALQSLGDRFVMVRWPRAGVEAAVIAMTQDMAATHEALRRSRQLKLYRPAAKGQPSDCYPLLLSPHLPHELSLTR